MKIALYVPSWPPGASANGIVTYASYLVPALRTDGHEVFVLTPSGPISGSDPFTVDLRNFDAAPTLFGRAMAKLSPEHTVFNRGAARILKAVQTLMDMHNIDVLEIEESFGWSAAISRSALLPVVVRLHGPWILNQRYPDRDREVREGRSIRQADAVTSPSAAVLEAVRQFYAQPLPDARVIPNAIASVAATDAWSYSSCDRDRILFVGRFDAIKGGDVVIRAFAELAPLYPELRLTFVGPDDGLRQSDGNWSTIESFLASVVPEQYRSRVTFLGKLDRERIAPMRRSHFLTIVASRYEISPYVVLEAMSYGCPMVASTVGGIPELINDRRNGILVNPGDVSSLVSGCRTLLEDRSLAARLGRQAWLDCQERLDPVTLAQQTVHTYSDAISRFKYRSARS